MPEPEGENAPLNFRSGLSLYPGQLEAIQGVLTRLKDAIPARLILLVDTSGQLVTSIGDSQGIDLTALGSLVAGDLAASQEIARLTGEFQEFQMVLREGEHSHMILSEAGNHLVFLALFSKEVPLGWARKLIQKAAAILKAQSIAPENPEENPFNPDITGDLTDLFDDALDDIWKG